MSENDKKPVVVFDAGRIIEAKLVSPEGTKVVAIRFPSDDEWADRQRRRKIIVKQLGRGKSEATVPHGEDCDADLLARVRQDSGDPPVDAFEASRVIENISTAEIEDVIQEGNAIRVTLRVLGGTTSFLLKVPTAKQVIDYRRGYVRAVDLPYGKQEMTVNLSVAGALYRDLVLDTQGYQVAVPIIHQAVVVRAAVDALDTLFQEDKEGNF